MFPMQSNQLLQELQAIKIYSKYCLFFFIDHVKLSLSLMFHDVNLFVTILEFHPVFYGIIKKTGAI